MHATRSNASAPLPTAVVWLLGFFLVANLYLLPGRDSSPRLTDLLGAGLWIWATVRLAGRGLPARPAGAALAVALLPGLWGLYAVAGGLFPTAVLSARWILAVPYALAVAMTADDPRRRRTFLWGLWWGLAANAAVLVLQYAGLRERTIGLGLAAADSELVFGTLAGDRNPGLHGHPNASAAVISLLVPVALLLQRRRRGWPLLLPLSFLLVLVGCHVTSTRAPLIVVAVTMVAATVINRASGRAVATLLLAALAAGLFYAVAGVPGGRVRWTDSAHTEANFQERLESNLASLSAAARNPFGLGLEGGVEAIQEDQSAPAAHDAFLHMGLVYGPLFGLVLLLALGGLALRLRHGLRARWGQEALIAFHVFGLFLFEEHLRNPSFIVLTVWLGAVALLAGLEAARRVLAVPRPVEPREVA